MDQSDHREPVEGFIETASGKLHYLDWGGNGVQTHLLHANGFCAGTYSPFVRFLLCELRVMASDIRGHGGSDRPDVDRIRHWDIFAEDLKRLIDGAMAPPVIGIGHSLGAVTTLIAAAEYPRLFSGIVLIDPVILPKKMLWLIRAMKLLGLAGKIPLAKGARRRKRTFKSRMEAFKRFASGRGLFKTWSEEFIDAYLECGLLEKDAQTAVLKCDPEMEAQIFESVPLNVWSYGPRIRCPVLAIRGEQSDTFQAEPAERLKTVIADCRLETMAGTGHFVPMEQPEACARAIVNFIRELNLPVPTECGFRGKKQ